MFNKPISSPDGVGVVIPDEAVTLLNGTGGALAIGDLVALDIANASGDVDYTKQPGVKGNVYAVATTPAAIGANTSGGIYLLAAEAMADNTYGKFWLRKGRVLAKYDTNSTTAGQRLVPDGDALDSGLTAGKIVAIALEAGNAGDVKYVLFDGTGLGQHPGS